MRHFEYFKWLAAMLLPLAYASVLRAEEPKPETPQAIPSVAWHSNVQRALGESREKDLPLLLLIELPDQLWSRQLLESFSADAVVPLMSKVVPVRVNINAEIQLLDRLTVRVVPDLRIYNKDGRQVAKHTGQLESEALKAFIEKALTAKPDTTAATLETLFPSIDLEAYAKLERDGKLPEGRALERLIDLAGGPPGETRIEAQRMLRAWAPALAVPLASALNHAKLKRRVTAFEILADLQAPLGSYDPWNGPAGAALAELQPWAAELAKKKLEVVKNDAGQFPPLPAELKAQVEADLLQLAADDGARREAAWQRLVNVGKPLAPILRLRARDVIAADPALAGRYDELRFRILLSADAMRRQPGAAKQLSSGAPGSRAAAVELILKTGDTGLRDLAAEAACDRDALVRETAIRNLTKVMDDPGPLLRDALKDPELNVRTATLAVMASLASKENAEALTAYLRSEPDADMICHAIRALAVVKSNSGKAAVRELAEDKRWQVRATAAEALGKMHDNEAGAALSKLIADEDGFVVARAIEALSEIGSEEADLGALEKAVETHPGVTLVALKAIARGSLRKSKGTDALLRKFIKSPQPDVRAKALLALASDTNRPALDEINATIKDPSPLVRAAAIEALRSMIDREKLKTLLEADKPPPEGYVDLRETIVAQLKDPDDPLRLEAVQTLCYFGDSKLCETELEALILHKDAETRSDAYSTFVDVPGATMLALIKRRLAHTEIPFDESELSRMTYRIRYAGGKSAASDWQADEPIVEAFFTLLPHVAAKGLPEWWESFYELGMGRESNTIARNTKAFSALIAGRLPSIPAGPQHDAVQMLWLRSATLDAEQLAGYWTSPNPEIRRLAAAQIIRAEEKGPDEWVKKLIQEKEPMFRKLGIAAAIPRSWRHYIEDPVDIDVVGGMDVRINIYGRSYSSSGNKVPKVVELPVETLEKLLTDENEDVRVITAFLMAMEEGDHGLPVLVRYWKSGKSKYKAWSTLLKAITLAWDDAHTPHLEAIYDERMRENRSYEAEQIYSETSALKGERLKKLRARIARENPQVLGRY